MALIDNGFCVYNNELLRSLENPHPIGDDLPRHCEASRRKHRKQAFYQALASEDWNEVLAADNVNIAVNLMEDKIKKLMDKCMPIKYVRMSTRDPILMTPLVKSLFRAKSRISLNNEERLRLINCRISEVISENRRNPRVMIGSRRWWENVDSTSQRRNSSKISLDPYSLDKHNDHFGHVMIYLFI